MPPDISGEGSIKLKEEDTTVPKNVAEIQNDSRVLDDQKPQEDRTEPEDKEQHTHELGKCKSQTSSALPSLIADDLSVVVQAAYPSIRNACRSSPMPL